MNHGIYIYVPDIGVIVRVFSNGPGVIPKTLKMVLDASLLNTQHYKVRIKGKVEKSWGRSSVLPTPWCSSCRKGCLRVTLDYGRQLYFTLLIYIYIYIYIYTQFYRMLYPQVRLGWVTFSGLNHHLMIWSESTISGMSNLFRAHHQASPMVHV